MTMNLQKIKSALLLILVFAVSPFRAQQWWNLNADKGIVWHVDSDNTPHSDHIEMSGLKVSTVIRYGVNEKGEFSYNRGMVWPMLRTVPNDTHASLMRRLGWNPLECVLVNNKQVDEKVRNIVLDGTMSVESQIEAASCKLVLKRIMFPSVSFPAFCERYEIKNESAENVSIEINSMNHIVETAKEKGVSGSYRIVQKLSGPSYKLLKPSECLHFDVYTFAVKQGEQLDLDFEEEYNKRKLLVSELWGSLKLETPDPIINKMFDFAKIRASESIYDTACGLLHGPGGESYYAAIWANDQAEYIGPFFPFLGYQTGNLSSLNAYLQFARFMNKNYDPLPSSIIAEGTDVWAGAGDRGDAAMIAYGASRYALARGSQSEAEQLWPLIEWCLEYCRRKINDEGVVSSDSDELEGRFPAGNANLCTSSLYYDALNSAAFLGKELRKSSRLLAGYAKQARQLKSSIERYFGANVEGFDTYRYYKENKVLRSWICIPLTVGIFDRKEGTIDALFSSRLWTENGLLTQAGSETFWDRSTLYALRGVYACGEVEKATEYLKFYSQKRLLGSHVPYAIEAWPEGNQRHLSAESGLYCRIITEGLFGIRPTGFKSFMLTPRLPNGWNEMSLKNIRAFNSCFDLKVERISSKEIIVTISAQGKICLSKKVQDNATLRVELDKLLRK